MSYAKKNDQAGLRNGEAAVTLDTGEVVALMCEKRRDSVQAQTLTYFARCRRIDETGNDVVDAHGQPVVAEVSATTAAGTDEATFTKELMLMLLGEAPTLDADNNPLFAFGSRHSIKDSITLSAKTGISENLADLL